MTIPEFLDKVPWAEMVIDIGDAIRHRDSKLCPICSVWGGDNTAALCVGYEHGLTDQDAIAIMNASDVEDSDFHDDETAKLRVEMIRRIVAAQ